MSKQDECRKWLRPAGAALAVVLIGVTARSSPGFPRYTDGCQNCHGIFDGPVSPKGSIFPFDSKHEMHRANTVMNTECTLCHFTPGDSPFTYQSAGTANTPGFGCAGCHGRDYGGAHPEAPGLRRHHYINGVTFCGSCHPDDPEPLPENVQPPYYGSIDTAAFDACNSFFPPDTWGESFTLDNDIGRDNDGDNQYDGNDADCGGCPWDCADVRDGAVGVTDFLALLSQWGQTATPCDFGAGGIGVDVGEFLEMLSRWGACP
jgi:hypothetical protein